MEKFKTILKWIGISLIIILAIIIILVLCMSLIPGFKLFGYKLSTKKSTEWISNEYYINNEQQYEIVIKSNKFDIDIIEDKNATAITASFLDSTTGFIKTDSSILKYTSIENVISFDMLEREGWIFGNGQIKIILPTSINASLNLTTNSGNILVNKQTINTMTVNLDTGSFEWKAEEVTETSSENENEPNSPETVANPDNTNNDTGTITTTVTPIKDVTIGSLTIFSNKGLINLSNFENINIGDTLMIKANSLNLNITNISGQIIIDSKVLNLNINKINNYDKIIRVNSQEGNISIGEITGNGNSSIITEKSTITLTHANCNLFTSSTSGNITISKAYNDVIATTTKGNVSLESVYGNIKVSTNSGSVAIGEYFKNAEITTDTGDISGHCKSEENPTMKTVIEQNKGNINLINENNQVNITSQNGSNISITFRKMVPTKLINHTLDNVNGSTNVYIVVAQYPFKVRAVGNVSGELGTLVKMSSNTQFVEYRPSNYGSGTLEDVSTLKVNGGNVVFTGLSE